MKFNLSILLISLIGFQCLNAAVVKQDKTTLDLCASLELSKEECDDLHKALENDKKAVSQLNSLVSSAKKPTILNKLPVVPSEDVAKMATLLKIMQDPQASFPETTKHAKAASQKIRDQFLMTFRFPGECLLCKGVINGILDVAEIENVLETVKSAVSTLACNLILPEADKAGCHDFLDQYGTTALKVLLQQMDAKEYCQSIDACAKSESFMAMPFQSYSIWSTLECGACHVLIDILKIELGNKQIQTAFQQDLESLCGELDHISDNLAADCVQAVDEAMPAFWKTLNYFLNAGTACKTLALC